MSAIYLVTRCCGSMGNKEKKDIKTEEKQVQAEAKPEKAEKKPEKAEVKPEKPAKEPEKAEEKPAQKAAEPKKAENKPAQTDKKPVKTEKKTPEPKKKPENKAVRQPAKAEPVGEVNSDLELEVEEEQEREREERERAKEREKEKEKEKAEEQEKAEHTEKDQAPVKPAGKSGTPKARRKNIFQKHGKTMIVIAALLFVAFLGYRIYSNQQAVKAANDAPEPEFRNVERRDISNSIAVTATVEADDKRTVSTLVSNTRVLDVNYKIGDYVDEGDIICTFDTAYVSENIARLQKKMDVTSEKSKISISDAVVEVDKKGTSMAYDAQDNITSEQRKHWNYDTALEDYYNACDGYNDAKDERDKKEREYESAKSKYKEWKEKYDNLDLTDEEKAGAQPLDPTKEEIKDTYTYYTNLYNTAKTAYDTAKSKVSDYESSIRTKGIALETARQGIEDAEKKTPRDYLSDGVDVNTYKNKERVASLDASIANEENEKTMAEYRQQLDNSVVVAPISGIITVMNVHRGDEFAEKSKTDVCVIQDDSGYTVKGNVDQYNISKVREGMKALIKTQATGDEVLEGIVKFVSPVPATSSSSGSNSSQGESSSSGAASTNVSYPVEIELEKRDARLRLGMTAETSLVVNKRDQVLVVPYDCVTEDEFGYKCVYVEDDTKASKADDEEKTSFLGSIFRLFAEPDIPEPVHTRKVTVSTGLETDYYIEIISDEIKEGDRVKVPDETDMKASVEAPDTASSPAMVVDVDEGNASDNPDNPPPPPPGGPNTGEEEEGLSAGAGDF